MFQEQELGQIIITTEKAQEEKGELVQYWMFGGRLGRIQGPEPLKKKKESYLKIERLK